MVSLFRSYKPLRNYIQQFDALSSLEAIWQYSVHISEGRPLPHNFMIGTPPFFGPLAKYVYPWDLETLAREIILHARTGGRRSLRNWSDLARAINHIRNLDDQAYASDSEEPADIMLGLHRIAHRQFPWQLALGVNPMMRALKIFGSDTVEAIATEALGMTARQSFTLGMAVGGHFLKKPYLSSNQDYRSIGIPEGGTKQFFSRMTCTLESLRKSLVGLQSYDEGWLYTWNPLEATPLISFDTQYPDRVICPLPRYLIKRTSGGLFYDLVKSEDFSNRFGDAFQSYAGEVIRTLCPSPPFRILSEKPYLVRGQTLHGVDWIVSDSTGHLFIETKAKRLTVSARTLSDEAALDRDLKAMAKAIAQHYRNIRDALDGKTGWQNDDLSIYPLILTLEDWFLLSPRVAKTLEAHVRLSLDEADVAPEVLEKMPYTIASAHEFETAAQVIAQTGVRRVMETKTDQRHRAWGLTAVVSNEFAAEMKRVNWQIFGSDFLQLFDELKTSARNE